MMRGEEEAPFNSEITDPNPSFPIESTTNSSYSLTISRTGPSNPVGPSAFDKRSSIRRLSSCSAVISFTFRYRLN